MENKAFGTYEIARICHVTPPTVGRWIQEGKIPSFTTGGGHRRVWDKDLEVFLKDNNIPVPPEVLSKFPLRVLVVDDEAVVRKLVTRILRRLYPNAEICEAVDGFEAGHKVSSLIPSLVLLDLKIPGIDGLRVCQMIRKDENLKKIKILAISGNAVEEARKQILAAGANDFLAKPFGIDELSAKLEKLIPRS